MKIINFVLALFLSLNLVYAQNNQGKTEDAGRIALASVISGEISGLNPSAQTYLKNKLDRITSRYGMGGSVMNERFIITADVQIVTKDITSTAPPMHAYTLEVSFFIGDGIDGKLFTSTSKTLKGVGETETKAFKAALKNIKTTDLVFKSFLEEGKNKIIEYYNSQCDFILEEAEMLVSRNEFNAAIYKLVRIPEVCKDCFDKAMVAVGPIYQKQIDRDCKIKLLEAQGTWNAGQNISSAKKAGAILATVEPDAACFSEVQELNKEIYDKVKQIEDREWQYVLKEQAQESERIEAYKAIGVAFGKNQPQTVIYNYRGWW